MQISKDSNSRRMPYTTLWLYLFLCNKLTQKLLPHKNIYYLTVSVPHEYVPWLRVFHKVAVKASARAAVISQFQMSMACFHAQTLISIQILLGLNEGPSSFLSFLPLGTLPGAAHNTEACFIWMSKQ